MRIQGLVDHLALNGLLGVVEKVDAQRGKVRVYMPSYECGRGSTCSEGEWMQRLMLVGVQVCLSLNNGMFVRVDDYKVVVLKQVSFCLCLVLPVTVPFVTH